MMHTRVCYPIGVIGWPCRAGGAHNVCVSVVCMVCMCSCARGGSELGSCLGLPRIRTAPC